MLERILFVDNKLKILSSISIALLSLGGCAIMPKAPSSDEIVLADYGKYLSQDECETSVKEFMKSILYDPETARYEFSNKLDYAYVASVPLLGQKAAFGFKIDAFINGKNLMGGYAGRNKYSFLIKDNKVIRYCQFTSPDVCFSQSIPNSY